MTKNEIEKSLREHTRNGKSDWITIGEIANATGKSRGSVVEMVKDLPKFEGDAPIKKAKRYFVPDVAELIYNGLTID